MNKQQTAVEILFDRIKLKADSISMNTEKNRMVKGAYVDCLMLIREAKELAQKQEHSLSASWAKSREQTRETAMHVGFAKGFMSGLECYEDYYSELENTDLDEDEFTRNYITDRFEETYGGNNEQQ